MCIFFLGCIILHISTFTNIIIPSSALYMPRMLMCFFSRIAVPLLCCVLWEVKTDIIQCIHLCFSMLAISFYFVNCVIISCKLSFNSRFTRNQIPIMSFLGFKKAELGC